MNELTFGDVSPWQVLGYDLDGLDTTESSRDVCQPVAGALRSAQVDGENGIDNSFGHTVVPILVGLSPDPHLDTGQEPPHYPIGSGDYSVLFRIEGVGADSSYAPVRAAIWEAGPRSYLPNSEGSWTWPVTARSVIGDDVEHPRLVFPDGWMAARRWVSVPTDRPSIDQPLSLIVGLYGDEWPILIHHPIVTLAIATDASVGTDGVIAGVLNTAELVAAMQTRMGRISPQLCAGQLRDDITGQIVAASDILADGTQDPSRTCDGISVGFGFRATAARVGTSVVPEGVASDPCPH